MKEISVKFGIVFLIVIIFLSMSYPQINQFQNNKDSSEVIDGVKKKTGYVKVAVTVNDNVDYVDLDEYLLGVVAGEMPANFEKEALKAQVVASRTYVYNRNLSVDNTTNTQVYLSDDEMKKKWGNDYEEYYQKIENAIVETKNEVMMYQGDYISALFFSSSNGYTENVEDYFDSNALPYLRSVDSHWDLTTDPKNTRQITFTKDELQSKFSCKNLDFNIIAYKKSGRVETLSVDGKEYSGREVREKLELPSSCFTIDFINNKYIFTTKGNGHGVGMSQYGAQAMALEGASYKDILNHYYTEIEIVNN